MHLELCCHSANINLRVHSSVAVEKNDGSISDVGTIRQQRGRTITTTKGEDVGAMLRWRCE